jgi:hypothetical protein
MDAIKQEPIGKIGDNKPPLKARLEMHYTDLKKRAAELLEAFARAPAEIGDDATLGKIGDLYRLMATCTNKAEALRKDEKEPFILDGKTVDAFFKDISDPIDRAMQALKGRSTLYSNAKITAERKRLADEEAARRAEAARALEAAQKAADAGRAKTADKHLAKAEQATAAAEQAQEAAQVPSAAFARTRGEHATVTTQTRWTHEVTDWGAIPLEMLRPFLSRDEIEKAIRNFVRQNKDAVPLAGVRIFQSTASSFR